jgi:hypothetical protein
MIRSCSSEGRGSGEYSSSSSAGADSSNRSSSGSSCIRSTGGNALIITRYLVCLKQCEDPCLAGPRWARGGESKKSVEKKTELEKKSVLRRLF